ncbi:IclR family transcriptional regulator [Aquabacter sp. CN5-332]
MPRNAASQQAVVDDVASVRDDETKDRGGVQSLARAFSILEEIARNRDGISLAELSKSVQLHNSTTFHLVKTMVSLGYVRQIKDSKRYRIGRPLFALAASSLDEIEMVSLATPVLEDLCHDTGETSHFAVRMGNQVLIVAERAGDGVFQMVSRAGAVRPAHCTALGKALLGAMTSQQFDRYLKTATLAPFTQKTITDKDLLVQEIENVRRTGIAYDDGELNTEVRCCATPVWDFTGQAVGAIGISGPIWRLSIQTLQDKAQLVRRAAERLSTEFGWVAAESD